MLVECGYSRVTTSEGDEYTFAPSLGRIASMGDPRELVELFAAVHGPQAAKHAPYVLACLCEQEDASPLIGWHAPEGYVPGLMPVAEMVVLAQHLLRHGMVGVAKPGAKRTAQQGQYAETFDASEYIAAARVHLGLSSADAESLSMTEFQRMFEMKFPAADKGKDVPTRDEYAAAMARIKQRGQAQGAARG